MATHDYIISNASGAAVRADLNNALAAIVTNNSSATAPTTTYAYQWWADTGSSPAVMKLRNAANSAWITLFQLDGEWSLIPFENGTAAAPSIYFKDSGTDTGIFSPGTDQVAISTGGTQRATVDASGRLLIGPSSARSNFFRPFASTAAIQTEGTSSNAATVSVVRNSNDSSPSYFVLGKSRGTVNASNTIVQSSDTLGGISFQGADGGDLTEAARISAEVDGTPGTADMPGRLVFATTADGASSPTTRATIDSSGRLLVGATTARSNFYNASTISGLLQIEGTTDLTRAFSQVHNTADFKGPLYVLAKSRGATVGSNTVVQSGDQLGEISFQGSDGTEFVAAAGIEAQIDGTPGANSMPGRLVFSTTVTGASSATERMRITSAGNLLVGVTSSAGYRAEFASSNATTMQVTRAGNDGNLIDFIQDTTIEGSISVSGTTVSYNGAHLSRWSQLPGGAERIEILRGTVLSNIDEMCGWDEEENEQLNRMKISDVEGDPNVSGVFQAWDDDDDTYTDDFYCAMTGDFIIRIAEGVTVRRGDLLMSAGDGTAKPQDDDIIRSKTIAKVTSTHVTCTYEDGSYCVPCVLMAC